VIYFKYNFIANTKFYNASKTLFRDGKPGVPPEIAFYFLELTAAVIFTFKKGGFL